MMRSKYWAMWEFLNEWRVRGRGMRSMRIPHDSFTISHRLRVKGDTGFGNSPPVFTSHFQFVYLDAPCPDLPCPLMFTHFTLLQLMPKSGAQQLGDKDPQWVFSTFCSSTSLTASTLSFRKTWTLCTKWRMKAMLISTFQGSKLLPHWKTNCIGLCALWLFSVLSETGRISRKISPDWKLDPDLLYFLVSTCRVLIVREAGREEGKERWSESYHTS